MSQPDFISLRKKHAALLAEVDADIRQLFDLIDFRTLSVHNKSLAAYAQAPFETAIETEKNRFIMALEMLTAAGAKGRVCDLGTFIPYLPLMLAKSGFQVSIVEKWSLYSPAFEKAVKELAAKRGVEVIDLDMVTDDFSRLPKADVVLLMAVIEHFNGSPRQLLGKIRRLVAENGLFILEVPNMAELGKRLAFLRGRSPLPAYADYFSSDYPFTGHNREMTTDEVTYALTHSGFAPQRVACYDFSAAAMSPTGKQAVLQALKKVFPSHTHYEAVMALARPA